jgi:hypothetical protein
MDPFDWANLGGVNEYIHKLGFNNTYYGQLYHSWWVARKVRRIYQEDPEAHFVLIGFSFGANMVRNVAQSVRSEGINVDLLMYLGGNTLKNIPRDRPENAVRVVNVLAHGYIWNGTQFDDAENINVEDVWHFGSPTHPRTLEALTRELTLIAASIPSVVPAPVAPSLTPEDEPSPRVMPRAAAQAHPDEWDFLKPAEQLRFGTAQAAFSSTGQTAAQAHPKADVAAQLPLSEPSSARGMNE